MHYVLGHVGRLWIRIGIAGIGLLAAFSVIVLVSGALVSAQAAELRISELQCNDNPEVVRITNQGGGDQDLTGWTLRSDPVTTEFFDLTAIGVLAPTVSVFVESGPAAQGSYVWSTEFVLRDSDATDFARIVNANGAVVHEVKCQSASPSASAAPTAQPTATATPATPRPTVTAAPTAAPIGVVPNGGGPPGTDSWQSGGALLIGGASVLAGLFGAVVLGRMMSDRPRPVAVAIAQTWSPPVPSRRATHHYGRLLYLFLVLVLAALVGASGSSARGRRR